MKRDMAATRYDVVIVGSGACGGTLAAHLARAGVNVCVVEGGPKIETRTDFNTHAMPHEFPNRAIPKMRNNKPGFDTERTRGLGGKSMLWNAVAWRFGPRDFEGYTRDGVGYDFPIKYQDLAPWYEVIEREVGVCGNLDGLEDLPDGIFLPPAPLKCSDILVQRGAAKLGAKVIHVRKSTLTRPKFGRPACHYCGNCMAGCDVAAKYNSWDGHMRPLMKTGKITLQLDSIVYDIGMDKSKNRATSVRFLDRNTRKQGEVQGRVVVLAAACVQNIALLLQSGLANSSGRIGKDFIPHFTGGVEAFLTKLIGKPVTNDEGFLDHAYLPSFMHTRQRDYARSWGAQFNYQNRRSVGWARAIPGMGASYKAAVKDRYPSYFIFSPYGEKTPDAKSYVALDTNNKDKYGMPEVKRHLFWNDNDMKIFRDMQKQSVAILEAAGAEIHRVYDEPRPNHEIGGTIMGKDPRHSVTDSYGKTHDIDNLYTLGGNILPSASEKNPTHTFMALSARTAAHLIERFKKGDLA